MRVKNVTAIRKSRTGENVPSRCICPFYRPAWALSPIYAFEGQLHLIIVGAMTTCPTTRAEVSDLLNVLPQANSTAVDRVRRRDQMLTKPLGALGRLEKIVEHLAAWQGGAGPTTQHVGVRVFAGNHGVAGQGVSAFPPEVTLQMVANFEAGGAAVNQISAVADASFEVIALDLENPTEDFTSVPAMTEGEFITAFTAGWDATPIGLNIVAIGEMGIANTTSAAAVAMALYGGDAVDWVGPGTGVKDDALALKTRVVASAVDRHTSETSDALDLLRRLGGRELVAMAGAIVRARCNHTVVLIDGYVAGAAAAALECAMPGALDHCLAAHVSAEPGHHLLLEKMDKQPLLNLGMRLGEASGAALAIPIVRAAVACHTGMATFDTAGVTNKD
jgi:nicotinate-nucleotide--dimethylbenzimidazole phosphoribosyltransferase